MNQRVEKWAQLVTNDNHIQVVMYVTDTYVALHNNQLMSRSQH